MTSEHFIESVRSGNVNLNTKINHKNDSVKIQDDHYMYLNNVTTYYQC